MEVTQASRHKKGDTPKKRAPLFVAGPQALAARKEPGPAVRREGSESRRTLDRAAKGAGQGDGRQDGQGGPQGRLDRSGGRAVVLVDGELALRREEIPQEAAYGGG